MADKDLLAKKSDLLTKQDTLIAGANITIAADGKTISAPNATSVVVTPIYQAGTLVAAIVVNGNTTNIYAPAQHGDLSNQNLAVTFSASETYDVGEYVIYQENLYKCVTAITVAAAWDSTKWTRVLVTDELGQGGDNANQNIADTYDITATYAVGDFVIYGGMLYKCTTAVTTAGAFNINNWTQTVVTDELGSGGGDNANQNIADAYDPTQTYEVDDYVIYNSLLYKCTTAVTTPGAFDSDYWTQCTVTEEMGTGSLELPDNWTLDENKLKVQGLCPQNIYGWGVKNTTYYTDTQMEWNIGGRSFQRNNAYPALIAYIVHNGWNGTICVSTNVEATYFSWNSQGWGPYEYKGYNWYISGMEYSMTYNTHSDNITYLGSYDSSQKEKMVQDIVDASLLNEPVDIFGIMKEPTSGYLFAGGGEESDLSDATFTVETDGTVNGTDFVADGKSWKETKMDYQELTQAEYDELTPAEKEDITFFITDTQGGGGGDAANQNLAADYDEEETYDLDDYVIHNSILYKCTTAITTAEEWDSTHWERVLVTDEMGGGGGNANDEELTYAEYLELTEAEKTNGTNYFITDINYIADNEFQPVVYSTEEREIGVWYDGKPLYQKTYTFSSAQSFPNGSWVNAVPWDNIMLPKTVLGGYTSGTDSYNCWSVGVDNGYIQLFNSRGYANNITGFTLQYTKTTDTAGSGTWTPQGVPAKHYSTEEKVIGTWIDGSTIYEKTYTGLNLSISSSAWGSSSILKTGIDRVINIFGFSVTKTLWNNLAAAIDQGDYIMILNPRSNTSITIETLVLQYTKSS